jgi:hypothetical protein
MNILQVFLLAANVLSAKLFTKVIHTPVFESDSLCAQHHIVLLKKTPFVENQMEYTDIYAVDFSPTDDITDPSIAWKIFLGKKIPGKIRLVHFDMVTDEYLFKESLHKRESLPIETIRPLDNELCNKILCWDAKFQLYKRNCQHFGRHVVGT